MASASAVECTATERMPISLAGAQDAQRDLAAVGDQDLVEHQGAQTMSISGSPYSTGMPLLDEDPLDAARRGAP